MALGMGIVCWPPSLFCPFVCLSLFLQRGLSVAQAGLELPIHDRAEFELLAPLDWD